MAIVKLTVFSQFGSHEGTGMRIVRGKIKRIYGTDRGYCQVTNRLCEDIVLLNSNKPSLSSLVYMHR